MLVKKETLRVAPLGVGLGDLPPGGPGVRMMLNLYFNFPAKTRTYSLDNLHQFQLLAHYLWIASNLAKT